MLPTKHRSKRKTKRKFSGNKHTKDSVIAPITTTVQRDSGRQSVSDPGQGQALLGQTQSLALTMLDLHPNRNFQILIGLHLETVLQTLEYLMYRS